MASNVTVAYLADVTDLRTKSALAKATLTDVNASVREQAAAFAELSDEAKGPALAALQALTAEQAKLKEVIAAVTAEQKRSSSEAEHNAGVFSKLHETVKLTGESFESMTASVRVWTNAASAIGEFALAGLGIERITESVGKWTEAAEAMQKLSEATGLTTDQLYGLQYVAKMTATPFEDVQSAVAKLARALEEAAESADSKAGRALAAMGVNTDAAAFKTATFGEKLDLITGKLSSYESGQNKSNLEMALFGRTGENLTAVLNELGRDGLDAASDKAKQLGLSLTGPASQAAIEYQDHVKNLTSEWQSFVNTVMGRVVPALDAIAQHYGIGTSLDQDIDRVKQKIAEISGGDSTDHPAAFLFPWVKSSELADLNKQLDGLLAKKAQLERDTAQHNQATFGSPNAPAPGSQKAPDFSDKSGEQIDQWKDQLLQMQVVDGKFHAMSAAQEAAFWQTKIGLTKAGTTEQREVLEQFEEASRRAQTEATRGNLKAAKDDWENYSETVRQKISADEGHLAQQLALAAEWVARGQALYGQDVSKYAAAIQEKQRLTNELAATQKRDAEQAASDQEELARAMAKPGEGEFKTRLSLIIDTSDLQAQLQEQIGALQTGLQAKLQELTDEMDAAWKNGDTSGYQHYYTQALIAQQNYNNQVAALAQKAADAENAAWQKVTGPIGTAFDRIVDSALSGHQRIAISAEQAGVSILQSWIKSIVGSVAHWVAGQFAMTAATTAGVAARVSAQTAGAVAGRAAQAAADGPSIMSDAAKAAAGAYAALAGIPLVGPVIAPIAAGVAFAAVAGYESMTSAEGGWDRVPTDGMITELHRNEMVLPASLAESVRKMAGASVDSSAPRLASAAASSGAGGNSSVQNNTGGNIGSVHYSPTIHAPAGSSADMASLLRSDKRAFASAINEIHLSSYANGGLTLPGRKPWR